LIDYYNKLYEISDQRRRNIENHIAKLKNCCVDQSNPLESNSSEDSFYSVDDHVKEEESEEKFVDPEPEPDPKPIHSSKSLDIINANKIEETASNPTLETFAMARQIKEKVLSEEMGMIITVPIIKKPATILDNHKMTDAQRNKLKVLSSEFGIEIKPRIKKSLTQCEINRNLVLGTSDWQPKLDNVNFVNKNFANSDESEKKVKKSTSLSLDFVKIDPPIPMSVDSTPMSESTTSRLVLSVEKGDFESIPTTGETQITDEGFVFDGVPESTYIPIKRNFFRKQPPEESLLEEGDTRRSVRIEHQLLEAVPARERLNSSRHSDKTGRQRATELLRRRLALLPTPEQLEGLLFPSGRRVRAQHHGKPLREALRRPLPDRTDQLSHPAESGVWGVADVESIPRELQFAVVQNQQFAQEVPSGRSRCSGLFVAHLQSEMAFEYSAAGGHHSQV
jgi:hypothetical protein